MAQEVCPNAVTVQPPARLIAFYLPQYHPISENDGWWGKGFTEWTNVASCRPRFRGHYQPHLPADLGFYDLRLPEARAAQADLARAYGIHGFCYYHYWFAGRRLLERPFDEVLTTGRPDLPFCLCWANENWTRTWDGQEREYLMRQTYSEEDDRRHAAWLVAAFRDPRYIRVAGKPLFLVYRAARLPAPARTAAIWREHWAQAGIGDVLLAAVEKHDAGIGDPRALGFDVAVEFQPDFGDLGPLLRRTPFWHAARKLRLTSDVYQYNQILPYAAVVDRQLAKPRPAYPRFRCATPSWDNSARRRQGAWVLKDANPADYQRWLTALVADAAQRPPEERIVFVNAWNEWAEGNHLEPCQRWGHAYLEATKAALDSARNPSPSPMLHAAPAPVR